MLCQRCRGLLVRETFDEWNIETNSLDTATRCLNCGDVEDALIRENHRHSVERRQASQRRRYLEFL